MSLYSQRWWMLLLLLSSMPSCFAAVPGGIRQTTLISDPKENTTLAFDDIRCPEKDQFCPISRYDYLDFYSWTTFDSVQAAENKLISASDADCAISSPNALFSWRQRTPRLWPRFVLNSTTAAAHGVDEYFDLLGLALKPMNYTSRGTRVMINAYGVDFNVSDLSVPNRIVRQYFLTTFYLRAGEQPQHFKNIMAIFPRWGKGVNMVEIVGVDPEERDVPLCIDDMRLGFHEPGYYDENIGEQQGRVNGDDKPLAWQDVNLEEEALRLSAQGLYL